MCSASAALSLAVHATSRAWHLGSDVSTIPLLSWLSQIKAVALQHTHPDSSTG
jgi:hypothetical protein